MQRNDNDDGEYEMEDWSLKELFCDLLLELLNLLLNNLLFFMSNPKTHDLRHIFEFYRLSIAFVQVHFEFLC